MTAAAIRTSEKGIAFIESHEGVVLKAYRCPAGVWTIGAGLTAASGVVKPKAGMVIDRAEASRLLGEALARNYEPRVRKAMPGARPHEYDGGVSFDYNTGRIDTASWVKQWVLKAGPAKIRAGLAQWRKGGGKVLPGLVRRRREEADVILLDKWPSDLNIASKPIPANVAHAGIVISLSDIEIEAIREGFRQIGYNPGALQGSVSLEAVRLFQERFDLKVDGLIGRATLSTLQRELDARKATKQGGTAAAGGTVVATGNEVVAPPATPAPIETPADIVGDPLVTWGGIGVTVFGLVFLAWLAFTYRDLIAARVAARAPKLAAWLRSF